MLAPARDGTASTEGHDARHSSPDARSLRDVAQLLGVASHPARLGLLQELSASSRTVAELGESLGRERRAMAQHVQALTHAGLIAAARGGRGRSYSLTEAGRSLLGSVGSLRVTPGGGPSAPPEPGRDDARGLGRPVDPVAALIDLLKALADPTRLRLLNLLASSGEICACHLHEALSVPQSTASRHLAHLRNAGLILGRRRGTWIYYSLARPGGDLNGILADHLEAASRADALRDDRERLAGLTSCEPR